MYKLYLPIDEMNPINWQAANDVLKALQPHSKGGAL